MLWLFLSFSRAAGKTLGRGVHARQRGKLLGTFAGFRPCLSSRWQLPDRPPDPRLPPPPPRPVPRPAGAAAPRAPCNGRSPGARSRQQTSLRTGRLDARRRETPRLSGPPPASGRGRGAGRTETRAHDGARTEPAWRACRHLRSVRSALRPMWLASLRTVTLAGLVAGEPKWVQLAAQ